MTILDRTKQRIHFAKLYFKNPNSIGAITPSSKYLSRKIISKIDHLHSGKIIVEIGPGTGIFTRKIVQTLHYNDVLILIELNDFFYKKLKEEFKEFKNVHVVNESILNLKSILNQFSIDKVDYIISGLPLTSFSKMTSLRILLLIKKHLKYNGYLSLFQYTQWYLPYLKKMFQVETQFVLKNIPSAFVFHCEKLD